MSRLLAFLFALLLAPAAQAQNGLNTTACTLSSVLNCLRVPVSAAPPAITGAVDYLTQTPFGGLRVSLGDGAGNDVGSSFPLFVAERASSAAAAGIAPSATSALSSGVVLKAAAGNLYGITMTTSSTPGYLLIFNAATVPADGAVTPADCIYIASAPATAAVSWRPGPGLYLSTGISAAFSTTGCYSKTASATAFISGDVQ